MVLFHMLSCFVVIMTQKWEVSRAPECVSLGIDILVENLARSVRCSFFIFHAKRYHISVLVMMFLVGTRWSPSLCDQLVQVFFPAFSSSCLCAVILCCQVSFTYAAHPKRVSCLCWLTPYHITMTTFRYCNWVASSMFSHATVSRFLLYDLMSTLSSLF